MNAQSFSYNPNGVFFDVQNNNTVQPAAFGLGTVTAASATALEADLLKDYGKVMYYKIEFGPNATTFVDTVYVLALQADDMSSWFPLGINDVPFGGALYHDTTSMEIVVDAKDLISRALKS